MLESKQLILAIDLCNKFIEMIVCFLIMTNIWLIIYDMYLNIKVEYIQRNNTNDYYLKYWLSEHIDRCLEKDTNDMETDCHNKPQFSPQGLKQEIKCIFQSTLSLNKLSIDKKSINCRLKV